MDPASIPKVNKWLVAFTVILPTFIEVMDTSVVNVSLPHIQGSLSAGVDEVTWVLTSYLVSNAVIIPITGWLAGIFGRKRYLIFSVVLFTLSSIACGASTSLGMLVVSRIFQGIGGGGLQPLSQAILLETFPQREHGQAMAVFGMGVIFAPILGPVLGGWITESWTWRWVFYINIPAGILAIFLIGLFIFDPPYIRRSRGSVDYWGLFFLSVGLGCLQIVLDKGEREDWFHSDFILVLAAIAMVALVAFILVELRSRNPVVNLRVFRDQTFTAGNIIMFTGFFAFFGSIVLLPLYLQQLMGYTALWAGLILGPGGITAMLSMPIIGIMMRKGVSARALLAAGLAFSAAALWMMSGFNLEAGFSAIAWPRVVQGFGMGLFFVPLSAATYVNISRKDMGNATSVFNLLRNLGGSFGVAFSTTVLAQRSQFHQAILTGHVTPFSPALREYAHRLHHLFPGLPLSLHDRSPALAALYGEVRRQAAMLAFNDTFWICAWITAVLIPLTFLIRTSPRKDPGLSQARTAAEK